MLVPQSLRIHTFTTTIKRAFHLTLLLLFSGLLISCTSDNKPVERAIPVAATDTDTNTRDDLTFEIDDPLFQEPFIDLVEWRNEPVRHRYVHGGFANTDTKFSFYFPPAEQYKGRFYQYITPVPDSENLSQGASGEEDKISFALGSGAYFIETNGGGSAGAAMPGAKIDPTIGAYRANAAAAEYSRVVAIDMYDTDRPFGYAFGGSGGGFRTLAGMENTEGVWDGAVPFVIGSPMALPNVFTVRTYAMRVLEHKLPEIADAIDVGSSKDPFTDTGLNDEERAALTEATHLGFPLPGWHAHDHLGLHAFALLFPGVVAADPSYFQEFWTKPGYEGYAPTASLKRALIDHKTTIEKLIYVDEALDMGLTVGHLAGRSRGLADNAWKAMQGEHSNKVPVALQLKDVPDKSTLGTDLNVVSGAAVGQALSMARLDGNIVILIPGGEQAVSALKVGDEVHFDNRNFLAVQTYHRHQVPGKEFTVWDQFRDETGDPVYPQRPMVIGPMFAMGATGAPQTGNFKGKMIVLENLYDTEAFPWQADWYRTKARKTHGEELDNNLRLWFTDHANHGDFSQQKDPVHTISYLGVLQQALLDVSAWVEQGVDPPANTAYDVVDGQVVVAENASQRKGIQPTVNLTANGGERAEVKAGDTVKLVGVIEVPAATGEIVVAEWDLDGTGRYAVPAEIVKVADNTFKVMLDHSFADAGTYFVTLRVASQRDGNAHTPFTRIQNLGRVRVVVAQ